MKKAIIYIHGKGGNGREANNYKPLFPDFEVIGFDYQAQTPWEAKTEFSEYFHIVSSRYDEIQVIANSIGAFYTMQSTMDENITTAFFISPIVDMEKLIMDLMTWAKVTEEELCEKGIIETTFGETLSWEYLSYVRNHPVCWQIPTHILYGKKDHLTSFDTISAFGSKTGATLNVIEEGEHWFHTPKQMEAVNQWITSFSH